MLDARVPGDEPRCAASTCSELLVDARTLLTRALDAIAEPGGRDRRTHERMTESPERVMWSDHFIGTSIPVVDELHRAVAAIALDERAHGMPPEKVIALLKSLVADANTRPFNADDERSLIEDVVRWGIEGYYAA